MVLRSGAIAGINGDYFDIHESGMPLNILVRDGQLLRSPWRFVAPAISKDGTAPIVRFRRTRTGTSPQTGETPPPQGFHSSPPHDRLPAPSDGRAVVRPPPHPGR